MKHSYLIAVILTLGILMSCGSTHQTDNSVDANSQAADSSHLKNFHTAQNSLDYLGIYKGELPGVGDVQISIYENNLYSYKIIVTKNNTPDFIEEKGKYSWSKEGNYIILESQVAAPNKYKVEENRLVWLDSKGETIIGEEADLYVLKKQTEVFEEQEQEVIVENTKPVKTQKDLPFFATKWILVELNGKSVKGKKMKEAFLIFDEKENRVTGNGSCNRLNASVEFKEGNYITFGNIAATKMACLDNNVEDAFFSMLDKVDNYSLKGSRLSLNKSGMSPLASFEGK